jgi:excisionase family DNA binding protein
MSRADERLLLTTSAVADLLDLHPSTVKRWSDEGSLPATKTTGGHRRFRLNDVLEAARVRALETFLDPFAPWQANVWLAYQDATQSGSFRRLINLALKWLSAGEVDLLGLLLFELGRRPELSFPRFLDEGIRGFMVKVGEEWRGGRLQVGEEHMAAQVVHEVLVRLRKGWDRAALRRGDTNQDLPVAIVGAAEGDQHDLGAQAIRVLLEREGWKVYFLGSNVPIEDFSTIQQGQVADLVCISFSPPHTLPDIQRAMRVLGEFYRPRYPYSLAIGGTYFELSPDELPEGPFEAVSVSHSAEEFLAWIQSRWGSEGSDGSRRVA